MSSVHTITLFCQCTLSICLYVLTLCMCVCVYMFSCTRHRYAHRYPTPPTTHTHKHALQSTLSHGNTYLKTPPQTPCHLHSKRWYLAWLPLESCLAGKMWLSGLWMYQTKSKSCPCYILHQDYPAADSKRDVGEMRSLFLSVVKKM